MRTTCYGLAAALALPAPAGAAQIDYRNLDDDRPARILEVDPDHADAAASLDPVLIDFRSLSVAALGHGQGHRGPHRSRDRRLAVAPGARLRTDGRRRVYGPTYAAPVAVTPPSLPDRIGVLRPLRVRDFAFLWTGMTVSMIGDGIYYIAIAWQVLSIENRPGALALVGVAWSLPQVIQVLASGALSDRLERRHLMIAGDAVRFLAIGALGVLSITEQLTIPLVLGLVVVDAGGPDGLGAADGFLDVLVVMQPVVGGGAPQVNFLAGLAGEPLFGLHRLALPLQGLRIFALSLGHFAERGEQGQLVEGSFLFVCSHTGQLHADQDGAAVLGRPPEEVEPVGVLQHRGADEGAAGSAVELAVLGRQ